MPAPRDFAVVGGGIVGCALAAFLAEGGAEVTLYEREAIAAGASGRNSGVVQDPLDPALTGLYEESLGHYRALEGFELPEHPSGLLLIDDEPFEHEGAELIEDPQRLEPALQPGLSRAGSTPAAPSRRRPPRTPGRNEPCARERRSSSAGRPDQRPADHRRRPVDP